jgi:hypothetical protein
MHLFSCFMPGLFVVDSYIAHFGYEVVSSFLSKGGSNNKYQ